MSQQINSIRLALPYKLGDVNCYLVEIGSGHVLVDTGSSNARARLEEALAHAGCQPGTLRLILLTHGDFDHSGNAAYLAERFGVKIAMHRDDAAMVERGDTSANRKKGGLFLKTLTPLLFGFGKAKRFKPDLYIDEGSDLSAYGLDARVLSIPGHSLGSIGLLMANGDLICGDLLENIKRPALGSIMDDPVAAQASLEKLRSLPIRTVYPGHGQPFPLEQFLSDLARDKEQNL